MTTIPTLQSLIPSSGTYTRTQFSYNGAPNVIPPNRLNPVVQTIFGNTPSTGFTPYPKPNINNPLNLAVQSQL